MSATHVVIDQFPEPGLWDMWLQWGSSVMQAATAIGTVAAVAVALWLGLRTARREERHDLVKARVVAIVLKVRLDAAVKQLIDLEIQVGHAVARGHSLSRSRSGPADPMTQRKIQELVDGLKGKFDSVLIACADIAGYEEYQALSVAPDDLAHDLADCVTRADILRHQIDHSWWVFTASMHQSGDDLGIQDVLRPTLDEIKILSSRYLGLGSRCSDIARSRDR